jgi:hypothetical protein
MMRQLGKISESRDGSEAWPDHVCDASIRILDQAAERQPIDDTLLQVANRQALKREIVKTVQYIRGLELDGLLAKQSWLSRFTGAAIEERLKFEVASQKVSRAFALLEKLSADSEKRVELMRADRANLEASLAGLDDAIGYGQTVLADGKPSDDFLIDRFQSKLANLITIRSANAMAIQQLRFAEIGLVALNDRFFQISTVLFPLWQQRLFAILHAPGKLTGRSQDVKNFTVCHEALEDYFVAEANQ